MIVLLLERAAELAAKKFNDSGVFLPGTGRDSWRMLFEAARKFSEEAYPGKPFPFTEIGAKCPLCQQTLDDGAIRLQQFEEYVQEEIEKTAQMRRRELDEIKKVFVNQNMAIDLDELALSDIALSDETLALGIVGLSKRS